MTYPDSLGGDLKLLKRTLDKHLARAVGTVHILPFYPSSADRGFCPLTHLEVAEEFGTWEDIQEISKDYDVMADIIAGHISIKSKYFQDYLEKDGESQYADLFLPLNKVYPDGHVKLEEIARLGYLTPIPPFINITFADGTIKTHWKTFMPEQADLDIKSPLTRRLIEEFIQNHAQMGVKVIRLDAIETTVKDKELGFHMVPEVYEVIQWMIDTIKKNGMEAICEIHGSLDIKNKIVEMGGWVYDFNLPELILNAIFRKNSSYLKDWMRECPRKQIAVISNHDGFCLGREGECINEEESNFTRDKVFANAGESTAKASGVGSNNLAADAINATLYEALFRDQDAWLLAQVIVLFAPGIPQLYYNDLIAQRNDVDLYHETGEGRSLIRHNVVESQIDHKFEQPFVQRLIKIMRFRNNYPAFDGKVFILDGESPSKFCIKWKKDEFETKLSVDFENLQFNIEYFDPESQQFNRLVLVEWI